jgi:sulfatase maturation enzyme AslB (radical SAM superfamily)
MEKKRINSKFKRLFKPLDYFRVKCPSYFLLPFHFERLNDQKEIIVNEVGDYLFCKTGTARKIVDRDINPTNDLYPDLISGFFISECKVPDLIDILATRYRTKKSFLYNFTNLHIFVITLRCNSICRYCQASRQSENKFEYDMSIEDLEKSIDIMFKSPSRDLTVEFQGGEPVLAFDIVKHAVTRIKEINQSHNKNITFVLCTNLLSLSDEILEFCNKFDIHISTSLDGPGFLHNSNRPCTLRRSSDNKCSFGTRLGIYE